MPYKFTASSFVRVKYKPIFGWAFYLCQTNKNSNDVREYKLRSKMIMPIDSRTPPKIHSIKQSKAMSSFDDTLNLKST